MTGSPDGDALAWAARERERLKDERYKRSAQKQREWWANMTPEERADYHRKRRAGLKRYADGRRPTRASADIVRAP